MTADMAKPTRLTRLGHNRGTKLRGLETQPLAAGVGNKDRKASPIWHFHARAKLFDACREPISRRPSRERPGTAKANHTNFWRMHPQGRLSRRHA